MKPVALSRAERPLVLALDVGTSSCRALLYDARARRVERIGGQLAYEPRTTADGGAEIDCSWCKDKYGLRWQIVPELLLRYVTDKDAERAKRAMQAMFKMKKIDIAAIEKAVAAHE